ncbi:AMP-binding protein [Lysobacter yangpyeongensis]|uniref:AMP-binding protein n=1 Tax=Lysobacter yangpyeongensis TaxID=346182 RepID=A0ABW0SNY9_9GAMM
MQSSQGQAASAALAQGSPARLLAFDATTSVVLDRFAQEVRGVAERLPEGRCALNLCEDRYRFMVALCAAALRGQTTLLPPSRAPAVVADVLAQHAGSYVLGDALVNGDDDAVCAPRGWRLPATLPRRDGEALVLADDLLVAIGYTSGSTGRPKPNPKTWASFRASTAQNLAALHDLLDRDGITAVVATVPPQHMYGMEMSVLLPLLGPIAVHGDRPFFPADIARAVRDAPTPPLLVTTPVHLRALVESDVQLPPLRGIVSATAPLSRELAVGAECRFGCEVREVFGSTETCVIARRRTAHEDAWTPLPGVRLTPQPDGTAVQAPHLAQPVVLADLVENRDDGRFELRGRNADLIEIAGKRASLGDLSRRLLAVDGVRDGVVFQLDPCPRTGVARIAALAVVAEDVSEGDVLSGLRAHVDAVFLPRPLRLVEALPRNETGKLPHAALAGLLRGAD